MIVRILIETVKKLKSLNYHFSGFLGLLKELNTLGFLNRVWTALI